MQRYGRPAVAVPQVEIHPRVNHAGEREKPPAQQFVNSLNHILAALGICGCLQLSVCRMLLLNTDTQKGPLIKHLT